MADSGWSLSGKGVANGGQCHGQWWSMSWSVVGSEWSVFSNWSARWWSVLLVCTCSYYHYLSLNEITSYTGGEEIGLGCVRCVGSINTYFVPLCFRYQIGIGQAS